MAEFPLVPLGDLVLSQDGRRRPIRASERESGPFPYYGASGVIDSVSDYIFDGLHLLIAEDGENLRTRKTAVAFLAEGKFWVNNHAHVVVANEKADTRYLCYAVESSDISGFLTGSTQPKLTQAALQKLPVIAPPLPVQRAIADVLGALDDKIESNHRLAKTAADLCDQIFLAASDVQCQISEAGQVTMGSSPPGDTYNTDGVGMPFYQGVTDFGFLSPTRRVWTTSPIRGAKVGETLVSVRAPVGRLNEASEQCCIGRGVAAISSSFQTTLYYALRQADAVWATFEGEGTVFGSINKGDLEGARIAWISLDRISELENELMDIHQCVRASIRELHSLTSLRDALLPELLSGRLRVKDAESMMENV